MAMPTVSARGYASRSCAANARAFDSDRPAMISRKRGSRASRSASLLPKKPQPPMINTRSTPISLPNLRPILVTAELRELALRFAR
jgi:hypothetical protein